jgi:hypothetical protein
MVENSDPQQKNVFPTPKENVFQTPNPTELKQAAKEDPIQAPEPEGKQGSFTQPGEGGTDAEELVQETPEEGQQSPIVTANLSGH